MRPVVLVGTFRPFPCPMAMHVVKCVRSMVFSSDRSVRSILVRHRVRLGALGQIHCSLGVVGCALEPAPRSVERIRCIPIRARVHSRAPRWSSSCISVTSFLSIPVRPVGRSSAFPFPCALGIVRVLSVHSRAHCQLSGSLMCFQSIHVHPGGRSGLSGTFGLFSCSLEFVGFVRVRWSIPVLPGFIRVRF